MDKNSIEKQTIIAEYLRGNLSYRKIGIKYGIDFRIVYFLVMNPQPMFDAAEKRLKKDIRKSLAPSGRNN